MNKREIDDKDKETLRDENTLNVVGDSQYVKLASFNLLSTDSSARSVPFVMSLENSASARTGSFRMSMESERSNNILSPLIVAFLDFSYSTALSNVADRFVINYSEGNGFELMRELEASGEGHRLIWLDLHAQYCDVIDSELQEFCHIQNCTAIELFQQLEDSLSISKTLTDALPGFVKLCSYHHFCEQMEAQATLDQVRYNARELKVSNARQNYFNGEWRGYYNFDIKHRDVYLKELGVPWVIRKLLKNLFTKEGKMSGIVRLKEGDYMQRTFNFGILGKQNESFKLDDNDYVNFNGGFGKFHLKVKTSLSVDGRKITMHFRRFTDNTMMERHRPSNYTEEVGLREVVNTWEVSEDGKSQVCSEKIYYPKSGVLTKGWTFKLFRVDGHYGK